MNRYKQQYELNEIEQHHLDTKIVPYLIENFYHFKEDSFYRGCSSEADKINIFRIFFIAKMQAGGDTAKFIRIYNEGKEGIKNRHNNLRQKSRFFDYNFSQLLMIAYNNYEKHKDISSLVELLSETADVCLGVFNSNETGLIADTFHINL